MASTPGLPEYLPLRPSNTSFLPQRSSSIQVQSSPKQLVNQEVDQTLTRRQRRFIELYLRNKPAKEAAKEAGYADTTAADPWTHILSRPAVRRELRRRLEEQYKDEELTTEEIINGWRRVKDYNLLDFGYIDPADGKFVLDLRNTTRDQLDVVEGIEIDAYGRQKLRLPSKHAAREVLAKYKKILSEDKNTGENGKLTIESLDSIVKNYSLTVNQTINNNVLPQQAESEPRTIEAS